MDSAVAATDLRKAYGDTVALAGVSLDVRPGEVFALIGPNGAGKTTLVRALTGTLDPDGGSSHLLGADPTRVDRDRIGVLPQAFSPPDRLTARELLAYYAGLYEEARDPDAVLADVGLVDAADTWYENLSGGQQRRVCVGATLVNDPDVCFLDEPTTGIDPAGRRTVWGLIEDLAAGGTTVVLTTHDMAEAERLGDRVGLLADGELIAEGAPDRLVADYGGEPRLVIETDPTEMGPAEVDPAAVQTDDANGIDASESAVPADLVAALEDLDFPAEARSNAVVVRGVDPTDIAAVVDRLDARDLAYSGLSWREPDLESVYLELARDVEAVARRQDGLVDGPDGRAAAVGGDGR